MTYKEKVMNKSFIVACTISLGIGIYTGYNLREPEENGLVQGDQSVRVENSKNSKYSESHFSENKWSSKGNGINTFQREKWTPKERGINTLRRKRRTPVNVVVADLESLFDDSRNHMEACAESYNLIKDLNEIELLECLDQLHEDNNDPARMPLLLILGEYAKINPENAIAFYENVDTSQKTKNMAKASIISSWSKIDPQGAYEWFQKNRDKNTSGNYPNNSFYVSSIFKELAKMDLNSTIEKLKNLNASYQTARQATNGIFRSVEEKEDLIQFVEKIANMDDKRLLNNVTREWTSKKPKDAAAWVDSLENEKEKKKLSEDVLRTWMYSEPQNAVEWYMTKIDEKGKQNAVDKLSSTWSWKDPKAAMKWIKSQEGIDSQKSIKNMLNSASYRNIEFVADNLDEISDKKEQKKLSQRIYTKLLEQNEKKAKDFLENSPFKNDIK